MHTHNLHTHTYNTHTQLTHTHTHTHLSMPIQHPKRHIEAIPTRDQKGQEIREEHPRLPQLDVRLEGDAAWSLASAKRGRERGGRERGEREREEREREKKRERV